MSTDQPNPSLLAVEKEMEMYKAILDTMPMLVCLYDSQKTLVKIYNMPPIFNTEYDIKGMEGTNIKNLIHSTDIPNSTHFLLLGNAIDAVFLTGKPSSVEWTLNGSFYESTAVKMNENYVLLYVRTITPTIYKQVKEERLIKNELSFALTAGGLTSWSYDVESQTFSSLHNNKVIGSQLSFDDLLKRIQVDYRSLVVQTFQQIIYQGERHGEFTVEVTDLEGKDIWVSVHAMPQVYTDDGKVAVVVGSQKDVSEKIIIEKSRNELLKQNALIMDNANAGFVYITPDYKVAWENTSKVLPPELSDGSYFFEVGQLCYKNEHKLLDSKTREYVAAALEQKISKKCEKQLPYSIYIEMTTIPVVRKDGVVEGVVIKIENISERKKAFEHLKKLQQETAQANHQLQEMQQKIEANNQLLLTVMDNMPCYLFIKDVEDDYRYIITNKKFYEMLSFPKNLMGKTDFEIFPLEQAQKFRQDDIRTVEEGKTQIMAEEAAGNLICHTIKTSLKDTATNKTLLIGVGLDVTEQKRATKQAEESERKTTAANQLIRAILDCMPCALFIKNAGNDFKYEIVNRLFCHQLGLTEEEILGKNDAHIFDKEAADRYRAQDLHVLAENKTEAFEDQIVVIDNQVSYWQTVKTPFWEKEGEKNLLIGMRIDITDRINEQDQIKYSKFLLELTFSAGGIIPWEWDFATDTMFSNNPESVLYQNACTVEEYISSYVHPQHREFFSQKMKELNQGITNELDVKVQKMSKGIYEWTHIVGRTIIDPRTQKPKFLGITWSIAEDIRHQQELIAAKKKAEQSDALKSAFLANMSHEIRTPLNALVGFSQMIGDANEEERAQYLEIINNNSSILLNLINDVLDLAKIEAGYMDCTNTQFDLSALFSEMETTMGARLKPGVTLINKPESKECLVFLDKFRVTQILGNFLTNAIKFTTHGSIEMGYHVENSGIRMYVKDTGCGISEEHISKVFDRFEKFNSFVQGTGLGLPICKGIADVCHGNIGVTSELGKGSLFWVWLPTTISKEQKQEKEASPYPRTEELGVAPAPPSFRILLAEDDDFNYRLFQAMLRGYSMARVVNGKEAVEKAQAEDFQLILMDIRMPLMDGLEATQKIRQFNKEIPIVAITANAFEADRQKAMDAGCNQFLTKPINRNDLLEMVSRYV